MFVMTVTPEHLNAYPIHRTFQDREEAQHEVNMYFTRKVINHGEWDRLTNILSAVDCNGILYGGDDATKALKDAAPVHKYT